MYRDCGYDGDACNTYHCLVCGQFVASPSTYGWKFCPCCGKEWVQHQCRLPAIPRWAYDKWGNSPPYEVALYPPHKPLPRPDVRIEWRITSHGPGAEWHDSTNFGTYSRKAVLECWRAQIFPGDYQPWAMDYRMTYNGKVVLEKHVDAVNETGLEGYDALHAANQENRQ